MLVLLTSPLLVTGCDDLTLSMGEAALTIHGSESDADFGAVIDGGLGLMAEGSRALLIGAPLSLGPMGEERAGAMHIFRDPSPGAMTDGLADLTIQGDQDQGYFGGASTLCDLTGNGQVDLAVGAPSLSKVYIFKGPLPTGSLTASEADVVLVGPQGSAAGLSLACLRDSDGDLVPDLAIGAPDHSDRVGAVYVLSGGSLGAGAVDLDARGSLLRGDLEQRGRFGYAIAALGDATDDGIEDILIGAPDYSLAVSSREGAAYLFSTEALPFGGGATGGTLFYGEQSPDSAGFAVSSPGDINRDGVQDFLIGAPGSDKGGDNAGTAYLLYGRGDFAPTVSLSRSAAFIVGELNGDFAGAALGGGDINGDGLDDILIGAPNHIVGTETVGASYLVYGPAYDRYELELAAITYEGGGEDDRAGAAIGAPLSFFGDMRPEVIIGAPGADDGDSLAVGMVSVFGAGGIDDVSTPEP